MFTEIPKLKYEDYSNSPIPFVQQWTLTEKSLELHWHNYYVIDIILSGEAEHYINGKKYLIRGGTFHLVHPSDIHCISAISETVNIITIRFTENQLKAYTEILYENFCEFSVNETEFQFLSNYANAMLYYQQKNLNDLVERNFNVLVALLSKTAETSTNSTPEYNIDIKTKILRYCEAHFRESPSLNDITKYIGFSPSYFSSYFKKQFGSNYKDYINDLRLNYACGLLKNGEKITTACYSSGFSNLSTFNHCFKKKFNISPSVYKSQNNKNSL